MWLIAIHRIIHTPWKTNMDPENHWLVEENHLPGGQTVRVYVRFCFVSLFPIRDPRSTGRQVRSTHLQDHSVEHITGPEVRNDNGSLHFCIFLSRPPIGHGLLPWPVTTMARLVVWLMVGQYSDTIGPLKHKVFGQHLRPYGSPYGMSYSTNNLLRG